MLGEAFDSIQKALLKSMGNRNVKDAIIKKRIKLISDSADQITKQVRFREFDLKADEFCCSKNYLLICRSGSIFIYKIGDNPDLIFKKKIETSYLIYKRQNIKKEVAIFLYSVLLELIENRILRPEIAIEGVMEYLKCDSIESAVRIGSSVKIDYNDGNSLYFDQFLDQVDQPDPSESDLELKIDKNKIEIREFGTVVKKWKISGIIQHQVHGNKLLILTKDHFYIGKFL